ncbi:MAG: hypothetical protein ACXVC1_00675 [Tumebacillaceae bacterium]
MKSMKKVIATTCLSLAVLSVGSAMAATTYGPFSPVVPRLGGNWYSAAHPARGSTQTVMMGSIGGGKDIYGTVNDKNKSNISSETPLPANNTTKISSDAVSGQTIMLMLETSSFNAVDTQCTFSWTP